MARSFYVVVFVSRDVECFGSAEQAGRIFNTKHAATKAARWMVESGSALTSRVMFGGVGGMEVARFAR
jgi:hypothetical protein